MAIRSAIDRPSTRDLLGRQKRLIGSVAPDPHGSSAGPLKHEAELRSEIRAATSALQLLSSRARGQA